jgi:hypothetical protein
VADELPAGAETSEKAVAASSSAWGIVAMVLGMVVTLGGAVGAALGANTTAAVIVGAVVSVAGIVQKTLTDLGYIGSRTQVKKSFYDSQA